MEEVKEGAFATTPEETQKRSNYNSGRRAKEGQTTTLEECERTSPEGQMSTRKRCKGGASDDTGRRATEMQSKTRKEDQRMDIERRGTSPEEDQKRRKRQHCKIHTIGANDKTEDSNKGY